MPTGDAALLLDCDGKQKQVVLRHAMPLRLTIDRTKRYCTGWYDIETHVNHFCDERAIVDARHECCFTCRKKTAFNPAFYNTTEISEKQKAYNSQSHSVYIAHFGGKHTKAGMMANSRGLMRLYEQGALLYTIVGTYPNATVARNVEARLIKQGLRDSIRHSQKAAVLADRYNEPYERGRFAQRLAELGYGNAPIVSNRDLFLFGEYPDEPIMAFPEGAVVSGAVRGIVGNYVILQNNERLYGVWIDNLYGYRIKIDNAIMPLAAAPQQVSLF